MINTIAGSLRDKATALSYALYIEGPLVVGFAIQLLWLFILFFQAPFFLDGYHYLDESRSTLLSLSFLVVFPATCFAIGYYRDRVTKYLRKNRSTSSWASAAQSACSARAASC